MLSVKCGSRTASIPCDEVATAAELHSRLRRELQIADDATVRVLHKGKTLHSGPDELASTGVRAGAKLLVMVSSADSLSAAASARPERMRGFDDDDMRTRTGGLGVSGAAPRKTGSASPQYRFLAVEALEVGGEVRPGRDAALQRLHELSTDPAVLAILEEHRWSVGRLREMPPEGLVGVSSSCLMGLNRNRGAEIFLRLRTDDWRGLRPHGALVPVLLHELTHNVHDEHDGDFKALNSQLGREYALHRSRLGRGETLGGGAVKQPDPLVPPPPAAVAVGGAAAQLGPRAAAAQAALERAAAAALPAASEQPQEQGGELACSECEVPDADGAER